MITAAIWCAVGAHLFTYDYLMDIRSAAGIPLTGWRLARSILVGGLVGATAVLATMGVNR